MDSLQLDGLEGFVRRLDSEVVHVLCQLSEQYPGPLLPKPPGQPVLKHPGDIEFPYGL